MLALAVQIAELLLQCFVLLVLLRFHIGWTGATQATPWRHFLQALTDWHLRPLNFVLSRRTRLDWRCLIVAVFWQSLAAWLWLSLMQRETLALGISERTGLAQLTVVLFVGLVRCAQLYLEMLQWLLIAWVLMSWLGQRHDVLRSLWLLCAPLLSRLQRWLPPIGGVDLSPFVAWLLLFVGKSLLSLLVGQFLESV